MISSSSKSKSRSSTINTRGSAAEVFSFETAAVVLMDYDKQRTLRFLCLGKFAVNLMMQGLIMVTPAMTMNGGHGSDGRLDPTAAVMMCTCAVGGLHWPLAKDYPITRVGQSTFAFAMPGLLYGLQFPPRCKPRLIDTLVRVLFKFGHYIDLKQHGSTGGYPFPDSEPYTWQKLRSRIEQVGHATLSQFGHIPGRSPSSIANQASGLLRVIRMSATSKMIGNVILSGCLKAIHVHITGTARPNSSADSNDNSFVDSRHHQRSSTAAYSSISVFTKFVEALETAWVSAAGYGHLLKENVPAAAAASVEWQSSSLPLLTSREFKTWRLNKKGIIAFMEALRCASEVEQMKMNDSAETTEG